MQNIETVVNELVKWLQEKVKNARAEGVIFGLSGGIDSAVIAGISKLAFPETCLGVIMPCHSDIIDEEHGLLVANALNLKTIKVDLTKTFDTFIESATINVDNKLAIANVKPRLRMTTLYYYGQGNNYLVLGSSNRSEYVVGYFTKHGDSGVDLLPLASFVKEEIRELAKYLNIPDIVITKPPTAGLWKNQTDEDEMGFGYQVLDSYIMTGEGPKDITEKIDRMYNSSTHKREYPPIFQLNK